MVSLKTFKPKIIFGQNLGVDIRNENKVLERKGFMWNFQLLKKNVFIYFLSQLFVGIKPLWHLDSIAYM